MSIVPRTRSGRGLALAAVVLIVIDIFTIWASRGVSRWRYRGLVEYGVSGGAVYFSSPELDPFVSLLPRVGHAPGPREWWWRLQGTRDARQRWHGEVVLPLWHVWLPAIILAALAERRHAQRSRTLHECGQCRYDLSGLPPDAVCPECGHSRDACDRQSPSGGWLVPRSTGGRVLSGAGAVLIGLDLICSVDPLSTSFAIGRLHFDIGLDCGAIGVMTQPTAFVDQWGVDVDPRLKRREWWFRYFHMPVAGLGRVDFVSLPLWHAYLPAIAGAFIFERRHARRSRDPHACKACGYDKSGLPPGVVCPECGQSRA